MPTDCPGPGHFSTHDLAFDIFREMQKRGAEIYAHNLKDNAVKGVPEAERGYWIDVGDLDQFYSGNMAFLSRKPPFDLNNPKWMTYTFAENVRPAQIEGATLRDTNILAPGSIIKGASLEYSIVGYNTIIHEGASVSSSYLMGKTTVGRNAIVRKAIVDRRVHIPDGETVGVDRAADLERGFTISKDGVTVVPKSYVFKS